MLSFIAIVLIGAGLLSLPISSIDGQPTPFVDALFTATTSSCVTGLVVVPTVSSWSTFGQIVILVLIQIGGLGLITAIAAIAVMLQKRIGLASNLLLQDSLNLNSAHGIADFVKKVVFGTFLIEGIGALLYMPVFISDFGLSGIWISVFTSISAFCNAGIDIIAENSLCNYATNIWVNFVTSLLIILGGLGFIVWLDVLRILKSKKSKRRLGFKDLTLHSKIVLITTIVLIVVGAVLILAFEFNNPNTIGNYSLFDKIQIATFQSITTRTAGFATIPQENLLNSSALVCLVLMFIGGSPVGTAGGVKTVTAVVFLASAFATIRNNDDVNLFNRRIAKDAVRKSIAVICVSFLTMMLSTLLLSLTIDADMIDIFYETVSATATVGLTRNLTPMLNFAGKLIITATMYLGRVGPISLAIAFNLKKEKQNIIRNPQEDINVG
jgi:trk system potassium uptake protein TrkH